MMHLKIQKRKKQKNKFDIVIMAGGLGTRMRPISNVLPKPLIPLKERPILDHIMSSFIQNGFKKFYLIINHHSRLIKSYFHSIKNQKSKIFFNEEKTPLGTAGGLKLLNKTKNIQKFFVVTNCDTIYNVDYDEIIKSHAKLSNSITVVVTKENHKIPYGVCKINNNKISSIQEKPKFTYYANTGLYVLNRKILKLIPKNKFFDMTELITIGIKHGFKVGAYKISLKKLDRLREMAKYEKVLYKDFLKFELFKMIRIIPKLDIKSDSLVKGVNLEGLRVLGRPELFAKKYYDEGADEIIYQDVVASLYGKNTLLDVIEKTAKKYFYTLTVGGGIRTKDDIIKLLRAGADKVSINSAAVKNQIL